MTGLLVSVTNAQEAALAVEAGVDLIDLKDPAAGSLGRLDPIRVAAALHAVGGRRPVSMALGELASWKSATPFELAPIAYAKIGLSEMKGVPDWRMRWCAAWSQLPAHVARVAVVYADHARANAPEPNQVIVEGFQFGCRTVLVDTFDKHGPALLEHLSPRQIRDFVRRAREMGLLVVLAGRLDCESMVRLLPLAPDYLAVRSAACVGGRRGSLCAARTRELVELVRGNGSARAQTGPVAAPGQAR